MNRVFALHSALLPNRAREVTSNMPTGNNSNNNGNSKQRVTPHYLQPPPAPPAPAPNAPAAAAGPAMKPAPLSGKPRRMHATMKRRTRIAVDEYKQEGEGCIKDKRFHEILTLTHLKGTYG
jgi:hypothetical protein